MIRNVTFEAVKDVSLERANSPLRKYSTTVNRAADITIFFLESNVISAALA